MAARGARAAGRADAVGVLIGYAEDDPETRSRIVALHAGLAKRGWAEGRNILLDYRFAAGDADQYRAFAKELVSRQPDVIIAHSNSCHRGAATRDTHGPDRIR